MWQSTVSLICLLEVVHSQHKQRRRVQLLHRGGGDTWPRVSSPRCTISSRSPSCNLIICRFIVQPPVDARPNQDQGPGGQPRGAVDGAMEAFAVKHLVGADDVGAEVALLTSVAYQNRPKCLSGHGTQTCTFGQPAPPSPPTLASGTHRRCGAGGGQVHRGDGRVQL